jgi:polysaccharide biosynthesis protein PslJ
VVTRLLASRYEAALPAPALIDPGEKNARVDAANLLTAYAVVLMLIPATLIFTPLGQVGTPAIGAAACVVIWLIASWIAGGVALSGAGRPVRFALVIFSLAVLASFVAAMTRGISQAEVLAGDSGLIWLFTCVGLAVVASQCITDYRRLDTFLRRIVILGTIMAVIGLLQFFGIDLTKYVIIPGLSENSAAVSDVLVRGGFTRPWSTTTQPIEFSVVLAMILPFAIQQALDPARLGKFRKWAPVAVISLALPLSVTRSGIIGFAIVMICLIPTWKPYRQRGALGLLVIGLAMTHVVVGGLITTLFQSFEGFFTGSDQNTQIRAADYSGVTQYIAQRPFFGRGFGTFLPLVYRFTDNMYLLATVEIGVVGVLAMLLLFLAGMKTAAAGRRLTQDEPRREMGQALLASIAAAMVTSATFDSMTFPVFSGLFFMILGCAGAYHGIMKTESLPVVSLAPVPDHTTPLNLPWMRRAGAVASAGAAEATAGRDDDGGPPATGGRRQAGPWRGRPA